MEEKRLPSPQSIRSLIQQLKSGVDPDQQETIEELLDLARSRVEAAIPQEALTVLSQIPPTLLESYALLRQPIKVGAKPESIREETHEDQRTPARPAQRSPVIAQKARSITIGDMDGLTMQITAEDPEEQAYVDALAGLANQGLQPSQVQRGTSLYVPPPVTDVMQLDSFQGAYKGYVEVTEGKGKKAKKTTRTIAVHKAIYEAELVQMGAVVKDPAYWLPKHNSMTVYFPGEQYEVEVAWLLGDYDPQPSGVPAGIDPTPEQIAQYLSEGLDDEQWEIEVIKRHLRTPEQKAWMDQQDMSISDLLGGRHHHALDVDWILDEWNTKLGVKQFGF
jgi:hypothetical protein